jgi:hypothetical protein
MDARERLARRLVAKPLDPIQHPHPKTIVDPRGNHPVFAPARIAQACDTDTTTRPQRAISVNAQQRQPSPRPSRMART